MTRRESWLLRAFALWVTYEFVVLLWNVWHDHSPGHGVGFKTVHTVLAVVTITFAAFAWRVISRVRRRARLQPDATQRPEPSVV